MPVPSFQNLRVLALESRRHVEIGALIRTYGGQPVSAPAMREVPLESNAEAFRFAEAFVRGEFDVFVTLTGVGLRAMLDIAAASVGRDAFIGALKSMRIVARGPKPLAVLREIGVVPWVTAPSPNTWHELLNALDQAGPRVLEGTRLAVQEYGISPVELLEGLRSRGATVTRVPIYRYALPEDLAPLRAAVRAVADGAIDVALFTTATQVVHLFQVADQMNLADQVRQGVARLVVASVGPTTSEELREYGIRVDLEAGHPKMGVLVREAAEQAPVLLAARRGRTPAGGGVDDADAG